MINNNWKIEFLGMHNGTIVFEFPWLLRILSVSAAALQPCVLYLKWYKLHDRIKGLLAGIVVMQKFDIYLC